MLSLDLFMQTFHYLASNIFILEGLEFALSVYIQ